jgi:tRNA(Ile)-lysidine synthase
MLEQNIAAFISRVQMFSASARVGVAVSGGADSVCLLHILRALRSNWNLRLTVLHLNHSLRGAESDADEQFVRDLASAWELPFIAERADVAAEARAANDNLEQAARTARRRFFHGLIHAGVLDCVALGHTRNDQAETVLFRLLRGAFTTGLSGMRPVTRDGFVRPLLEVTRSEVETWLKQHGVSWREDSSNRDCRFARNRIRRDLLPMLESQWNPQIAQMLASYARMAQDDDSYWNEAIAPLEADLLTPTPDGAILSDVSKLTLLPDAVLRRLLRRAIECLRGDLRGIDYTHIATVLDMVRQNSGHARTQLPGLDIVRSFDWIRFFKPAPADADYQVSVIPPCSISLPGSVLDLELIENSESRVPRDTLVVGLDWTRVRSVSSQSAPLYLRNWRPGDSYQPNGVQHARKLKDLFQDSRIPLWERRNWPVLVAGDRILWSKRFGPAQEFAENISSSVILTICEGV